MTFPVTPKRRERLSRAAAPTNMAISDSEEDGVLRQPAATATSAQAKAKRIKVKTKHEDSSSDSNSSITTIKNADIPLKTLNKPTSLNKRTSSESDGGSPSKKPRRVVLKLNKSAGDKAPAVANTDVKAALAQALTLSPSHAEVLTQLSPADASRFQGFCEGLNAIQAQFLSTLQSAQEGEELKQARKTIELLEQQLKSRQPEDTLSQSLANEHALRRQNKRLQENYDDLEVLHEDLKMAYHNEIQARKSRPNGSFKLMDDEVDKEWRRIAFDIRQFVLQILTVEPFRVSAPKGTNHQEIEALKRIQKKTPELAPFKFQKYIWERLVTDVFQAGVNTWGGPTGQAFNLFCLDISKINFEGMEELSRTKSHTAEILSGYNNQDNLNKAQDIARVMKNHLLIFMDKSRTQESGKLLWNIVRRAVELNGKFLKSKAFFLTNWVEEEFDLEDLDICYTGGKPEGQPTLDIEISPRLSKIGNADGKHMDKAVVMCKPQVTILNI
ncbi:hypothetical protein BKA59DRAFT_554122 [Fusarium tricinctum]|uniref:Uncharacterized protein n=1 Tax=Fusarium tricinctum TaxID=61284 RepID=A0A8K0RX79_9HYPO|nr:hypothetical protein BKA59DRAFT_554122 [Fusarium tricinctum]